LLPLARNALKKLRTLRHPDVLKFLDSSETESQVWIITEQVDPLASRISFESGDEDAKIWGLSRLSTALQFIHNTGAATHGNVRPESVFVTPSGEWRLGGFEVLSSLRDQGPVLYVRQDHKLI
jgi:SCY1-like protein 1